MLTLVPKKLPKLEGLRLACWEAANDAVVSQARAKRLRDVSLAFRARESRRQAQVMLADINKAEAPA